MSAAASANPNGSTSVYTTAELKLGALVKRDKEKLTRLFLCMLSWERLLFPRNNKR